MDELLRKTNYEIAKYKTLHASLVGTEIHITGKLDIGLGNKNIFAIKIVIDRHYPKTLPKTYEVEGRIKQVMDRHYFTGDDPSCCLDIPHMLRKRFPEGSPLSVYIDKLVIPYFKNQVHYEITGEYVSEYPHGYLGIYVYYQEAFGLKNKTILNLTLTIINIINTVLEKRIKGYTLCPCGGKRKQKKCHIKNLKDLKKYVGTELLLMDLDNFEKIEKKIRENKTISEFESEAKQAPI